MTEGARAGEFLILMEMENVETRDRYFPNPGDDYSEELRRFMEQHPDTAAAWDKMGSLTVGTDTVTDHVVVVE